MQIIITGGGGFLGQKLASALLNSSLAFNELLLVDLKMPARLSDSPRLRCLEADLTQPGVLESVITANTSVVYHLAAIVSSHAEDDFDLGWKVNLDLTRLLLEACRRQPQKIRFVFSSSLAVYGGTLPECVTDTTALTPRSSYGAQKAACELLVNDYTRKGYVDGLALRLPTICVRPGKPNRAASSFVSAIIREPLQGETTVCPVSESLRLWISSPATVVAGRNVTRAWRGEQHQLTRDQRNRGRDAGNVASGGRPGGARSGYASARRRRRENCRLLAGTYR